MRALMRQTRYGFARQHGIWGSVVIAGLYAVLLWFISSISLGEQTTIVPTIGLWMIEVVGGGCVVMRMVLSLQAERQGGVIDVVRTTSRSLYPYVIGKRVGYAVISMVIVVIVSSGFGGVVWATGSEWSWVYVASIGATLLKIWIIIARTLMMSSIVRPMILIVSIVVFVVTSHMAPMMLYFFSTHQPHSIMHWISRILYYILPSFADMSIYEYLFNPVAGTYTRLHLGLMIGSSIVYVVVFLFLGILGYTRGALTKETSTW